ncbi:hypothetical protein COT99_01085, partial [Candidatus Falkowbacteria bacterium CG10_big_fil_rev_8_21_14_0_10_43_10]
MYLEKLEIHGFKSFASKNALKFSGGEKKSQPAQTNGWAGKHGITAIVGPNGSGKSNIADAVRWVLGEQSVKLLRGKKSEDVIFSGSAKKASLSLAEVSLYLNNFDGWAPVDYREVVVTRRLYRDGESEYLLNGSKVRLLDISLLLAKAKFGQRAYSVIGQGMVENFLNTSIAERKEFFDEATGVKIYQIKRDDSMNKLKSTRENLVQAGSLLAEIEPRMRSLTRQMKKLQQRAEIARELDELQKNYYASQWHKLNDELKEINGRLVKKEQRQREQKNELEKINKELEKCQTSQYNNAEREELDRQRRKLEAERNETGRRSAEIKAEIGVLLEASGRIDMSWLVKREGLLREEIKEIVKEIKEAEDVFKSDRDNLDAIKKERDDLEKKLVGLKEELSELRPGDSGNEAFIKKIKAKLDELLRLNKDFSARLEKGETAGKLSYDFNRLNSKLRELRDDIGEENRTAAGEASRINSQIIALEEKKNKITEKYITLQSEIMSGRSRVEYSQKIMAEKSKEAEEIKDKLNKKIGRGEAEKLKEEEKKVQARAAEVERDLEKTEQKINGLIQAGQRQRDSIIKLQQQAHELQGEYNAAVGQINEIKIGKARIETKIEDLESEIRNETSSLRVVIDFKNFSRQINQAEAQDRVQKLKHQLELIGGIDPEVKKEYEETKVRYEFLFNQFSDLQSGIGSLDKIVSELDKTIAEKFDAAFAEIAKQFERYFKILFNGGSAKIEKMYEEIKKGDDDERETEEIDADETKKQKDLPAGPAGKKRIILRAAKKELIGIEIQATPPGKKIKNITMLSGGERALTAIALICAIISVNPSPFMVLDEVDAALDEANSGRLSRILEELSNKTQFIVITHNRSMMYIADIIYGVTMGDDSVSKLLSI